ncbi:MAG: response regulator [Oscillospiraceae bacterium]
MIVDDEAEVREGMVQQIDWASLGFEVTAEAENGLDALEKAEACEIDLLITDIKMPFVDGLSMISEFRILHPTAKVIIFTGFDDVDYARQAIKLGVTEYVLKPVNAVELTRILADMRERLDRENDEKRDIALLRSQYERSLPAMRERFLSSLLWRRLPEEELLAGISAYGLDIDLTPNKLVMVFDISLPALRETNIERELIPISIGRFVDETLGGRCRFATYSGFSQIVAITGWEGEDPVSRAVLLGNDVCLRCKRILDIRVSCGVSNCYENLRDTPDFYAEAGMALEYKGEPGQGRAIYIGDAETAGERPSSIDSREEQRLLAAVRLGGSGQAEAVSEDILRQADKYAGNAWQRQAYLMSVCNALNGMVLRYGLSGERELTDRMSEFSTLLCDDAALGSWIDDVCAMMHGFLSSRRESVPKALAEKALRFIVDNYSDASLTAESVCSHLHVSRSYFFSVFKRETGRSFVQYLTDIRMDRALELLHNPDTKTLTVAHEVGYEEPNYFSHVFKQRFGMTPAQYRRRTGGGG